MDTLQATRDRVAAGLCTLYSASTGVFCSEQGEHTNHNFN